MVGNIIAFVVGLIVGLLIGWYYWGRRIGEQEAEIRSLRTALNEKEASLAQLRAKLEPDDLTKVEGIGPKIQSLLQGAGIYTFSQLAATGASRLEQILAEAEMRLANPATWPEQAKLAAAGNWQALEKLQDALTGGRRE
ncbi:MAG: hypothetical protein JSV36_03980 [Anaerolineae bacterium]|nr:MAG: hypothetical protein JSV36_03980 [Anaerolineae bacterium]